MDYKAAHKIRMKYPEILTEKDMDEIVEQWLSEEVERDDMFWFSCCWEDSFDNPSLTDFELYLKFSVEYTKRKIRQCCAESSTLSITLVGMLAITAFDLNTGRKHPYETDDRKEQLPLRYKYGKLLLDEVSAIDPKLISESVKLIRDIENDVDEDMEDRYPNYKSSTHPWEEKLNQLLESYL